MSSSARRTEDLVKLAVKLPASQRLRLVQEVLASLPPEEEKAIDQAWAAEVERRAAELDEGKVKPLPWSVVKARARKSLRGRL